MIEDTLRRIVREELLQVIRDSGSFVSSQSQPQRAEDRDIRILEAAHIADVHPNTIKRWMDRGFLTRRGVGRNVRVGLLELHALLRGGIPKDERRDPEDFATAALKRAK